MARRTIFLRDQGGSAAAEFALVLPLLLTLAFTMFDGAYYVWNEHKVVMGVRDAARYASRLPFSNYLSSSGGTYTCPISLPTSVESQIKNMARTGQISGGNARVSGWVDGNVTVTVTCASGPTGLYASTGNYAPRVQVSANVAYQPLITSTLGLSTTLRMGAMAQSAVMGI